MYQKIKLSITKKNLIKINLSVKKWEYTATLRIIIPDATKKKIMHPINILRFEIPKINTIINLIKQINTPDNPMPNFI